MKAKYVILRSSRSLTRSSFLGSSPTFRFDEALRFDHSSPARPTVEVADLNRNEIAMVTRDRDVVSVTPAIPMKLIAPVDRREVGDTQVGNVTWGVSAVGADTSPYTGKGVVVAVLDTGIDATHTAFNGVKLELKNFTDESAVDDIGHGTHCAGTIFGRSTNGKRIGVAPGVERALIGKVLGQSGGSSEKIADAIQWAVQNGANVISMSLGIDFPGYVESLRAQGLPTELAVCRALEGYRANVLMFENLVSFVGSQGGFARMALLVGAAGNESRRDLDPEWEITVSPPAVAERIISVAALERATNGLRVAPFSNTDADVSGPGVDILSAKSGGGLVVHSGTSMATPHVAGVAALWWEKLRAGGSFSSSEWTGRLIASGSKEALAPGFDPHDVGSGLVRAPQQ